MNACVPCLKYRLIKQAKYTLRNRTIERSGLRLDSADPRQELAQPRRLLRAPGAARLSVQQHRLAARASSGAGPRCLAGAGTPGAWILRDLVKRRGERELPQLAKPAYRWLGALEQIFQLVK